MFKSILDRLIRLRHELAWVVVGQTLAFLGGFASIKLLTNTMGSEGYGRLALGMTIAGLLNMFIYGPIGQVVSRYFSVYRERENLSIYFFVLKKTHMVVGFLLILFTVVAGALVRWWLDADWAKLVVTALLFGIVGGINNSFLSLQGAIRQRKVVALHQAADTWVRPVLAMLMLWFLGNSAPSAFVGFIVGTLLITLSQGFFALRSPMIREHWHSDNAASIQWQSASREYFSYASSIMIFAGFAAISMYSDRWILKGLFGESEVGVYAALYLIGNAPITLLFGLIYQFMVPIIFERAGAMITIAQAENSSRLLSQVVVMSVVLLVPIVGSAYYFAEPIVRLLTNETFTTYSGTLWLIVMGSGFFNIGQLLSLKGMNFARPEIYLLPKAAQAISFLLLTYFLAKQYGLPGVAAALFWSSLLYLVMIVAVNRRLGMGST